MDKQKVQNAQNHSRFVPPFHFFVLPVFLINAIAQLVMLRNGITFQSVMNVLLAFAFILLALCARIFALTVQDRVIRLEMQLRFERLLPELRPRFQELTVPQFVSLRFASDEELPALARQVLDEKLSVRKDIKGRIKNWRPDFLRA